MNSTKPRKSEAGAIVKTQTTAQLATEIQIWNEGQIRLIKEQIAPKATDDELVLFGQICQQTGLNPFLKEIYAIHRWDKREGKNKMAIQTGIDGFRKVAHASGRFGGASTWWCGADGAWRDIWLAKEPPAAAKVIVFAIGGDPRGFDGIALWSEFAQDQGKWQTMPAHMLAKCAEVQAIRKAFPRQTAGLDLLYDEQSPATWRNLDQGFRKTDLWWRIEAEFQKARDAERVSRLQALALQRIKDGQLPNHAKGAVQDLVDKAYERIDTAMGYPVTPPPPPEPVESEPEAISADAELLPDDDDPMNLDNIPY